MTLEQELAALRLEVQELREQVQCLEAEHYEVRLTGPGRVRIFKDGLSLGFTAHDLFFQDTPFVPKSIRQKARGLL